MNKEEITALLPHREDMLLIEEAYRKEDGSAEAFYTVRGDEFFLRGHFPDYPVVPGVILCEMIAQSACVLLQGDVGDMAGKTPFYTGIDNVRFRSQVRPGDRVRTVVTLTGKKACFYFIHGELYVGDKLCVKGDFSFAVVDASRA